jgi:hypothetical protein
LFSVDVFCLNCLNRARHCRCFPACLTISDTAFLSTLISFISFCQIKCAWMPQSAWLAHLSRTSCTASVGGGARGPVFNSRKEHVTCTFFKT